MHFSIWRGMLRLLLALLLSISLVTGPATARAQSPSDCGMSAAEMMAMAETGVGDEHEQMACCTPDCTVTSAPAVFDGGAAASAQVPYSGPLLHALPDFALHSVSPAAADPPPRPSFA